VASSARSSASWQIFCAARSISDCCAVLAPTRLRSMSAHQQERTTSSVSSPGVSCHEAKVMRAPLCCSEAQAVAAVLCAKVKTSRANCGGQNGSPRAPAQLLEARRCCALGLGQLGLRLRQLCLQGRHLLRCTDSMQVGSYAGNAAGTHVPSDVRMRSSLPTPQHNIRIADAVTSLSMSFTPTRMNTCRRPRFPALAHPCSRFCELVHARLPLLLEPLQLACGRTRRA